MGQVFHLYLCCSWLNGHEQAETEVASSRKGDEEPESREATASHHQRPRNLAAKQHFSVKARRGIQVALYAIGPCRLSCWDDWPGKGSDALNVFCTEALLNHRPHQASLGRAPFP